MFDNQFEKFDEDENSLSFFSSNSALEMFLKKNADKSFIK